MEKAISRKSSISICFLLTQSRLECHHRGLDTDIEDRQLAKGTAESKLEEGLAFNDHEMPFLFPGIF